jgi:hypothetical protein
MVTEIIESRVRCWMWLPLLLVSRPDLEVAFLPRAIALSPTSMRV